MERQTLVIFDGNFMAHRARHTTGRLRNGIAFGMIKSMDVVMRDLNGTAQVWVFDGGISQERLDLFPDYKGNRGTLDNQLISQLDWTQPALSHLAPIIKLEGVEADDIISALANEHNDAEWRKVIVSSDQDFYQLCNGEIEVYNPIKKELVTDESLSASMNGVDADKYLFVKSMIGDPSDNIDGVKGIGWGTAVKIAEIVEDLDTLDSLELKGRMSRIKEPENLAKIHRNIGLMRLPTEFSHFGFKNAKHIFDTLKSHEKDYDSFHNWLEASSMNSILKKSSEWRERYG